MSEPELLALLALGLVGTFTPGPNNTLSAALAANHGLRHAWPFVCAVPCGWGLLLLACHAGLGVLVQQAPFARWVLLLFGASYLLWLAWRLARSDAWSNPTHQVLRVSFVQGVALQIINPKAWFLAITVASGWVVGFDQPVKRLLQVLPLFMGFGFVSNLAYAWAGAALRVWLQGPDRSARRLRTFNRIMALGLLATVVWMALSTSRL